MPQAYSGRYAAISQRLLRDAQRELDLGDLIQASEKTWGAAAHAIKALAQMWGWYHQGHHRLDASVVDYIVSEREGPRDDLIGLVPNTANGLCIVNYYEHELYADTLQLAIDATGRFVAEMEKIRAEPVPVFPPSESLSRSAGPTVAAAEHSADR